MGMPYTPPTCRHCGMALHIGHINGCVGLGDYTYGWVDFRTPEERWAALQELLKGGPAYDVSSAAGQRQEEKK